MKQACDRCKAIVECKHRFGKYWPEKSSNGTGCEYPIGERKGSLPPSRRRKTTQGMLTC